MYRLSSYLGCFSIYVTQKNSITSQITVETNYRIPIRNRSCIQLDSKSLPERKTISSSAYPMLALSLNLKIYLIQVSVIAHRDLPFLPFLSASSSPMTFDVSCKSYQISQKCANLKAIQFLQTLCKSGAGQRRDTNKYQH